MAERKGPFKIFPHGQYKGLSIEELMRKDPHFFLVSVKRWMDVSPSQASYFSDLTGGGEIPSEFVREFSKEENVPDIGYKSIDQILQEQYVDFENKCWRNREDNSIISSF